MQLTILGLKHVLIGKESDSTERKKTTWNLLIKSPMVILFLAHMPDVSML